MNDNRRDFIKKSIAMAAVAAGGIGSATGSPWMLKQRNGWNPI